MAGSLAAFSERLAENMQPNDRIVARVAVLTVTAIVWILLAVVLQIKVDLRFGA